MTTTLRRALWLASRMGMLVGSGIAAGAAGRFGLVVGVDRGVGKDTLTEAGADLVVTDLEDLLR